ncbi:hypothetical protein Cgig2_009372 [Carnegiea gigantea]|uniref:Uncharacterized protein n=1 Tax=Carnegiea gigantea TaxID=171969 RepID=A0A9Q1Q7Y3_9CARY|nr:hypothetical protein Cgig2_009372 [Carnegiea gigantea]
MANDIPLCRDPTKMLKCPIVPGANAAEEATKEAQPKHQQTLSTTRETTSAGKTSSTSTTATKRRLQQEARKNRNICNTLPTSEDEQPQAPTAGEEKKSGAGKNPKCACYAIIIAYSTGRGRKAQQKTANPSQQGTPTSGQRLKFVLQKRKKVVKKTDAHQNIGKIEQDKGEKTMHSRNSPNVLKNTI